MKIPSILPFVAALATTSAFVATPPESQSGLSQRDPLPYAVIGEETYAELAKRRGGGGGGGRGGGGSSGGSSGSSSSSSGSSGSSGGSSGGSGSTGGGTGSGRGSSSSNIGGSTTTGSGPRPAYGGGSYYGGGASVPYKAGSPSRSGISPFLLGAGVAGLAFWPGLWLYGAYMYPYHHPYTYYNRTAEKNETKPVICGCAPYNPCACDENSNSTYMLDLIGDGSYNGLNKSVITVANVNGTETILINGTLPNGTTAAGGTEDPNAGAGLAAMLYAAGWWPVVATVVATVFL